MTTKTTVHSAVAEMDMMAAPALAIVNQVHASSGGEYVDVYLYAGPPTDAYYAYPMRLRWWLTPDKAASMARTLRQVADAIDAKAEARIEATA